MSTEAEPDYVSQMQLSLDLLDASRRLHNAQMGVARCRAAIETFPLALVWRTALAHAVQLRNEEEERYNALISRVRWAEWGLIDESGP